MGMGQRVPMTRNLRLLLYLVGQDGFLKKVQKTGPFRLCTDNFVNNSKNGSLLSLFYRRNIFSLHPMIFCMHPMKGTKRQKYPY